jgi:hypothetical protein
MVLNFDVLLGIPEKPELLVGALDLAGSWER